MTSSGKTSPSTRSPAQSIDALVRRYHHRLNENDERYFLRKYTARAGFAGSQSKSGAARWQRAGDAGGEGSHNRPRPRTRKNPGAGKPWRSP
jgi:hypothetical protein